MARAIGDILGEAKAYIDQNAGQFNGVIPGNVIAHLGTVNPNLWNQLNESFTQSGSNFGNTIKDAAMGGAAGTFVLPGIGTAIGTGIGGAVGAVTDFTGAGAPTLNEWAAQNPGFGQALIGTPVPPPAKVKSVEENTPQNTSYANDPKIQAMLNDLFGNVQNQGVADINKAVGTSRKRAIEDAAVLGNLKSTGTLGEIDRGGEDAISKYLAEISGKKIDTSQNLMKLDESNREFNLGYGLDRTKMDESTRQFNLALQRQLQADQLATALGKAKADAAQPSTLDQIIAGLNGAGNLAKGVGSVAAAF